ncbi:hypothetical protein SAMN05444404_0798 [Ruegeria lacuscaerulensis ITI-1157]|nr:hypothetical protein SAMN05444404_0798 [Ruegeria lacuscaerulensis ITI-1157]
MAGQTLGRVTALQRGMPRPGNRPSHGYGPRGAPRAEILTAGPTVVRG